MLDWLPPEACKSNDVVLDPDKETFGDLAVVVMLLPRCVVGAEEFEIELGEVITRCSVPASELGLCPPLVYLGAAGVSSAPAVEE